MGLVAQGLDEAWLRWLDLSIIVSAMLALGVYLWRWGRGPALQWHKAAGVSAAELRRLMTARGIMASDQTSLTIRIRCSPVLTAVVLFFCAQAAIVFGMRHPVFGIVWGTGTLVALSVIRNWRLEVAGHRSTDGVAVHCWKSIGKFTWHRHSLSGRKLRFAVERYSWESAITSVFALREDGTRLDLLPTGTLPTEPLFPDEIKSGLAEILTEWASDQHNAQMEA